MAPSAHAPPSSAPTEPQPSTQQRQEELPRRPDSPDLPKPHTAVTPGPRATRLQEIFASSLSHTLARISWENVAACYPTVAARAPTLLRSVQRQVVDGLNEQSNVR